MVLEKLLDSNFAEISERWFNEHENGVLLLKFEAAWCGPCKLMTAAYRELDEDYFGDAVKICAVNIDNADDLAGLFRIQSIPTTVILTKEQFKKIMDGNTDVVNEITILSGVTSPSEMQQMIKKIKG